MIGAMLPMTALTCRPTSMLGRTPVARLPYLAPNRVSLRPLSGIRPARHSSSALAASFPAGGDAGASSGGGLLDSVASTLTSIFPVAVLGMAAYSVARQSALAWVQPALLQPALGLAAVGLVLTLTFEDAARTLSATTRSCARALFQYAALPALGYLVSPTMGMPQELCVWFSLAGGCVGALISSLWAQKDPATPNKTSHTGVVAESTPTVAVAGSCCCCSKPVEASAAPTPVAEAPLKAVAQAVSSPTPASVEAFIARWGSRAGIEAAADLAAAAAAASKQAAAASGIQPVLASPAKLRGGATPPSVIAFIDRWGKRGGIDAAAGASTADSLSWAQAAAEKSLQSSTTPCSPTPEEVREQSTGVLVAAAVAAAACPSSRSRAGVVSFQGPSGSGLAAWLPEAAAKDISSNGTTNGRSTQGGSGSGGGKVKEAVAKLEAAFAKPSAPEPAPTTPSPLRADMNDFRRWGPRRGGGSNSSRKPSPATPAASSPAAAPEFDALAPFVGSIRLGIANDLTAKWSKGVAPAASAATGSGNGNGTTAKEAEFDALAPFVGSIRLGIAKDLIAKWSNSGVPAAQAAAGDGSSNGTAAKDAEFDALAPFVGSIRLNIASDLVNKWSQPAAAAPQASTSPAAVASLPEAAPKPAPKPVPRPALEPFAGNIRLELAQHYTKLWSAAQQGQEPAPGVGGDSPDALAPFAGSIRSNMAQHYTTLWAAPPRTAPQAAPAAPAVLTAAAAATAAAPSAPAAATLAAPLTGVASSSTTPASVRAFISRWGTPEGIKGAAAKAQREAAAEAAATWVKGQLGHVEAFLGGKGRFAGVPEARVLGEGIAKAGAAAAADPRLASAPESVQTFISRWGSREGIEAACQEPAPQPRPLLKAAKELLLRWTGLIPSPAPAVAEEESVEAAVEAVGDSGARLAQAPASVQSFITRWGTRDGIEAAAAATAAAASASEQQRVLAVAPLPATGQQWRSVGEQAHEIVHAGRWAARIQGPTAACAELSLGRRWRALAGMDEPPCTVAETLLARGTAPAKPVAPTTPPSVRAFISRWGSREGIEAAAGAADTPAGAELLEAFPSVGEQAAAMMGLRRHGALESAIAFIARWTGLQPAYTPRAKLMPAVDMAVMPPTLPLAAAAAAAAAEPAGVPAAAGRLAQAPESVQAFIARWGRREGIEAASR